MKIIIEADANSATIEMRIDGQSYTQKWGRTRTGAKVVSAKPKNDEAVQLFDAFNDEFSVYDLMQFADLYTDESETEEST